MASHVLPLPLADDDWYLLRRLALQRRTTVEAVLTDLLHVECERSLPGARQTYHQRAQFAEQILQRGGIDPGDTDYHQAAASAQALLDEIDNQHPASTL